MPLKPIDLETASQDVSLLLYGLTGSGKTHFGGTAPQSIFLSIEPGWATLLNIDPPFSGKLYSADNVADLKLALEYLDSGKIKTLEDKIGFKPKSVVIDTLTRMQEHEVLGILDSRPSRSHEIKHIPLEDRMEMQEWGILLTRMYRIMKLLPNEGLDVICLCQAREFEDPTTKVRKWMPNLRGQWGDQVGAYFSLVAYVEQKEVIKAGGERGVVYRTHFAPSGTFLTKSRYKGLPAYRDGLTFPELKEMILEARTKLKARPDK